MEPVQPIFVAGLFTGLHAELITLLRGLAPDDWRRPTVAGAWTVQDVAAHLLDVQLRRLSAQRDGARLPPPDPPLAGYADIVALINRLNAEWVAVARRFSPRVLTDLLEPAGGQLGELMATLDPFAPAMICRVVMDQDTAWRRMTKGLTEEQALARMEISGDRALGEPVAKMLSVMA
jgi:hypothetical protein